MKAYLIGVGLTTRVVAPEGTSDVKLFELAKINFHYKIDDRSGIEHMDICEEDPEASFDEFDDEVFQKAVNEVRKCTDAEMCFIPRPFPENHLLCQRGKYCEWNESMSGKWVDVYLYQNNLNKI